jgi:hypothetical protein
MQLAYQAGRCAEQERAVIPRNFRRYIAVGGRAGDGRTRPSHAARHGVTLPIDHPWWDTNLAPNGASCRCSDILLSENQANSFGITENPPDIEPDDFFDFNVCQAGSEEGTRKSLRRKLDSCGLGANAIWCGDNGLADSMQSSLETLENWAVPSVLASQVILNFQSKQEAIELQASLLGINPALAVVIEEYISTQHLKSDNASRQAAQGSVADEDLSLLNSLIDQAFDDADLVDGTFYLRLPDIGLGLIEKARQGKSFRLETFLNLFDIPEDLAQSKGDIVLAVKTAQAMRLINGKYLVRRGTKFSIADISTATVLALTSTTEPDVDVQFLDDIEQGDRANRLGISQAR